MGRGRPRLTPVDRPMQANIRLKPETADVVARLAITRGVSMYAFLGDLVDRIITLQKIQISSGACYGLLEEPAHSTLSGVLGGPLVGSSARYAG